MIYIYIYTHTKPKPVTPSTALLHTHTHTFATPVLPLGEEPLQVVFVMAVVLAVAFY